MQLSTFNSQLSIFEPGPRPVALLTGAAGRLGPALADALAAAGFDPILHYNTREAETLDLARAVRERRPGSAPRVIQADLADPARADALVDGAARLAGRLDAIVNNAAAYPVDDFDTLEAATLEQAVRLHVYAPLALTRALARRISDGPGQSPDPSVVNILDARAGDRDPRHAAYLLSKGMLADLTRQAARRYAPGIRVNGVAPGALSPSAKAAASAPLGRTATAEEVADAAVWLLRARSVTGEILHVDGGRHMARRLTMGG